MHVNNNKINNSDPPQKYSQVLKTTPAATGTVSFLSVSLVDRSLT
jgi:hypothetical protein